MVEVIPNEESKALEIIDRIRPETELPILLHMLSEEPLGDFQVWHQRGIDAITLAWSPFLSCATFVDMRAAGCLCGVSIDSGPDDWLMKLGSLWPLLDIVMVTDPGDGTQTEATVKDLFAIRDTKQRPLLAVKCPLEPTSGLQADLWIHPSE